jgi:hypothetical protein
LRGAAIARNDSQLLSDLHASLSANQVGAVSSALDELGAFEALRDVLGASPDARVRERRLLTWFDALRTLRFIHLIEVAATLSRLPVRQALAEAPFCGFWQAGSTENQARLSAFSAEQARPCDIGVESAILAAVNGR